LPSRGFGVWGLGVGHQAPNPAETRRALWRYTDQGARPPRGSGRGGIPLGDAIDECPSGRAPTPLRPLPASSAPQPYLSDDGSTGEALANAGPSAWTRVAHPAASSLPSAATTGKAPMLGHLMNTPSPCRSPSWSGAIDPAGPPLPLLDEIVHPGRGTRAVQAPMQSPHAMHRSERCSARSRHRGWHAPAQAQVGAPHASRRPMSWAASPSPWWTAIWNRLAPSGFLPESRLRAPSSGEPDTPRMTSPQHPERNHEQAEHEHFPQTLAAAIEASQSSREEWDEPQGISRLKTQ